MWEKVRKFGLDYCDLPTMLWNVSFMLRAMNLNIDSRNSNRLPTAYLIIPLSVIISYLYVYFVSMLWFVFWRCRETGDLIAAMIVLSLGVTSEIGNTKLICMFYYRVKIRELVDQCLACYSIVQPGSRFAQNLMVTLRHVKKRAMIFWLVIIGNGVVYVVKPLLMPGRHLMEDVFPVYGLEPFTETPNYEISFALLTAGVINTCYPPANITAFLIIITGYIEAQMLALSEEILNVWDDANKYYKEGLVCQIENENFNSMSPRDVMIKETRKNKIINEHVKENLHKIIKIHSRNINLLSKLEHVFRGAIALEFLLVIVGLIVELLGGLENTYLDVPFALMQVAMDCLTGQRLMDASVTFEKAVYSCKWEQFNVKNKKTVLLMLQASQKTMKLSAGGVLMLSFSCLMMVIRSIYSAYTTLRTTMNQK